VTENEISQEELRDNIEAVFRRVEAGDTLVVTIAGQPIAEIRPLRRKSYFASREALERIIREAPLDPDFLKDVGRRCRTRSTNCGHRTGRHIRVDRHRDRPPDGRSAG
jgi:antitoxin (DNA-binding transcriptional repressor) of toxin-antitoxin stability system